MFFLALAGKEGEEPLTSSNIKRIHSSDHIKSIRPGKEVGTLLLRYLAEVKVYSTPVG